MGKYNAQYFIEIFYIKIIHKNEKSPLRLVKTT